MSPGPDRGASTPRPRPAALPPRVLPAARLALVAWLVAGCDGGPSDPESPAFTVDAAGPVLQFAPPASPTPEPLRVQVRRASDFSPRSDVAVTWSVVEGSGATLGRTVTTTDSAGLASVTLTLGSGVGRYRVRAELAEGGGESVAFEAWAVDAPVLAAGPGAPVAPGETVTLEGRNFSPVAEHDVVLFDGVRARVVEATPERLRVEVPSCLPPGSVSVTVSLGSVASAPLDVDVAGDPRIEALPVGGSLELDGAGATSCVRLPAGARYLGVLRAAGTVAGARYPVRLRTLGPGGGMAEASAPPPVADVAWVRPGRASSDPRGAWDRALRERERGLVAARAGTAPAGGPGPASVPAVGEERTFNVLSTGDLVPVRAVARHVGRQVVLYEDVETPAGMLGPPDFEAMARRFDDLVYPVVTGVFGRVPDLDANGRVVVLLTPQVNRLTPPGSDGFVGGFFYGLDLLQEREGSNRGEIFYTVVPDPQGLFGQALTRDKVLASLPAILAHEFQHMIHFNERVLERDAAGGEAVWLSEGLAQMAEDLVAREARARGDEVEARLLEVGNEVRARRFLAEAPSTSLIIGSGSGSLPERGASWLFLRYVEERFGGTAALGALTRTTRTSTANVEAVTGRAWSSLLGTWGVALYDGSEPGVTDPAGADADHRYPTFRPRSHLVRSGEAYPLDPLLLGAADRTVALEVLPAAPAHLLLDTEEGPVSLALGRGDGGPTPVAAGVSLRLVRLR